MAAGTRWLVLLSLFACPSLSGASEPEVDDAAILGLDGQDEPRIDEVRLRLTTFWQRGEGYQSQAGTFAGPGSERALIIEPLGLIDIEQSPTIHHEIVVPVDIVSAASTNSVDVISQASGVNEAYGLEITSRFDLGPNDQFTSYIGWHQEEPFGSGSFTLGYSRSLADDNTVLSTSVGATFDRFDNLVSDGSRQGKRQRTAVNLNLAFSQLLSPTTVFDASYGFTFQQGTLQATYNSVPVQTGVFRADERFPHQRSRHGIQGRIAQHLPFSRTTLRAGYRYYFDDFDLVSHTADFELHQYLGPRFIARGSYRYYTQTAVDFFTTSYGGNRLSSEPRTADSDLAAFHANEVGLKLSWLFRRGQSFDASYFRYWRDTGLVADIVGLGYGGMF